MSHELHKEKTENPSDPIPCNVSYSSILLRQIQLHMEITHGKVKLSTHHSDDIEKDNHKFLQQNFSKLQTVYEVLCCYYSMIEKNMTTNSQKVSANNILIQIFLVDLMYKIIYKDHFYKLFPKPEWKWLTIVHVMNNEKSPKEHSWPEK